jgi:hypothetical protein
MRANWLLAVLATSGALVQFRDVNGDFWVSPMLNRAMK